MARPRTFSDEDLLLAAQSALLARGPQEFTLTDAAATAGISRPALIQRFGNREALLRAMALRETRVYAETLAAMPLERGRRGIWLFLLQIGQAMGDGQGEAARAAMVAVEASDPELRDLAAERDRLLQKAIADRLPNDAPEGLAALIHAVIMGARLQWVAEAEGPLGDFVLRRLRSFLIMLWPRQALALPGTD